ncbi:hypothetical protein KTJ54_17630 [Acinetobacter radioresistens]|uniref:hypothetical protein n=1 Tax=Acinetobacter radioresistens TaxID=40216 RepID=UPI0002E2080F|nr:hypothetical protein [Acinetobacter radioresistens]MCU4623898.1 hypothetical protein [Acinetobacter radioresistens]
MNQPKPQADLSYLNNFLAKLGKKRVYDEEFQRTKLNKIINLIAVDDWHQAQIGRANVEIYFNNNEIGIEILEDVLRKTDYKSIMAWDMLIDTYMQMGNLEKILSTFIRYSNIGLEPTSEQRKVLLHAIGVYLMKDLAESISNPSPNIIESKKLITYHLEQLEDLDISLEIYRKFISQIYNIFYAKFNGTVQPLLNFSDCELVIRVNSTVNSAEDLFELNNLYRDSIMSWYEKSNIDEQEQIEKITVYFKHKNFESIDQEASV